MNILMALGTLGHEGLLESVIRTLKTHCGIIGVSTRYAMAFQARCPGRMEVGLVALQAQERLLLLQQVVGHGSMGIMAVEAVLHYRIVFEHEWSLVAGMALETQIVHTLIGPEHTGLQAAASVRIVTV